jgi:hypothetical protein
MFLARGEDPTAGSVHSGVYQVGVGRESEVPDDVRRHAGFPPLVIGFSTLTDLIVLEAPRRK